MDEDDILARRNVVPLKEELSEFDKPFTVESLAGRWTCSTQHIRGMINRGELSCIRIGRLIRIPAQEVGRVECGQSSTEDDTTRCGRKTAKPGVLRSVPRIVTLPDGNSRN